MTEEAKPWEIRYTETAKNDLKSIFAYISGVLLEPWIAADLYRDLTAAIRSLETMPYRFHLYDAEPWKGQGIRVLRLKNYLAFYQPDEATHTVRIIRVMYGGRDIDELLKQTK